MLAQGEPHYNQTMQFQPMPLLKRRVPFDDPEWLFELKYDGFRALVLIEHGRAQLISRNGNPFASFADLAANIGDALSTTGRTILDGEICSLDRRGKPQFRNLLFRRGSPPCFFAFDLLMDDGRDLRLERLEDRKQGLRQLLSRLPDCRLKYVEHIDGSGTPLFERVCKMELEGIVAKHKLAPCDRPREQYVVQNQKSQLFPMGGERKVIRAGQEQRARGRVGIHVR
jgi:bifunctional non-homologous end joining protein LigD